MLDKLHHYLDGAHFTIVTDYVAVKTLLTAKWTDRQLIRWQAAIQAYRGRITIRNRSGALNDNAGGSSRAPLPNDRSNPAADLDPDQSIEIGEIAFENIHNECLCRGIAVLLVGEEEVALSGHICQYLDRDGSIEPDEYPFVTNSEAEAVMASVTLSVLDNSFARSVEDAYQSDKELSAIYVALRDNSKDYESIKDSQVVRPEVLKDLKLGRLFVLESLFYRRTGLAPALVVLDSRLQTQVLDT